MKLLKINSPAKVNLSLQIGRREANGYHKLFSLFQLVSLYDEIALSYEESDETVIDVQGDFDCRPEENLIYKSALRFCEEFSLKARIEFSVQKKIPQGGGLGGGSSNAAAAWFLMEKASGIVSEYDVRMREAFRLGSDVPFFFSRRGASVVSSYGEVLKAVPGRHDYTLVLVIPDSKISSSEAYKWLDQDRSGSIIDIPDGKGIPDRYQNDLPEEWNFKNSFQKILTDRYPLYENLKGIMLSGGALASGISGSGSTYYGVFMDDSLAEGCVRIMDNSGFSAFIAKPLDRFPDAVVL